LAVCTSSPHKLSLGSWSHPTRSADEQPGLVDGPSHRGENWEMILEGWPAPPLADQRTPTALPAHLHGLTRHDGIRTLFGTKKSQVQILSPRRRSGPVH
jgi:hypothetical protein